MDMDEGYDTFESDSSMSWAGNSDDGDLEAGVAESMHMDCDDMDVEEAQVPAADMDIDSMLWTVL
jgi:hypothetical protein